MIRPLFLYCQATALLLLLLFPFTAFSQQVKESLPTGALDAGQVLRDIQVWQDSLQALPHTAPDSVAYQAALDSLQRQGLKPEVFIQKSDSLARAFFSRPEVPAELKETEARLRQQISQAKEVLASELLPREVQEALRQLEQAGRLSASGQLPQPPGAGQLPVSADQLKAQAMQQALKAAGEPFSESFDKLGRAKADFNRYKGSVSKVESVKNMPKGLFGPNPLKDKSWTERVVLGSLWQLGKQERLFLDLGPTVAWRFTEKISVGAGAQYRQHLSLQQKPYLGGADRVGGYSVFSDFMVKSGFFGRLQYDGLSTTVQQLDPATQEEIVKREWVKGLSVGVGKDYALYKRLKGYALMQYNLLHEKNKTPFLHPLQAKVGFFLFASDLQWDRKK